MKFFLDTANLDEWNKSAAWGIVDGVTTNPSHIVKEGRPIEEHIREICKIVDGDISAASLHNPTHMTDAALFNHPLTDKGLEQFLRDWNKAFQEVPVGG
jgi:transaldolase